MATKRKRASSPAISSFKRQRLDSDHEDGLLTRAKRRQTITAVTPQREDITITKLLQRAPAKKKYGRAAQRRRELLAESESDSDSDAPRPSTRPETPENVVNTKQRMFKSLKKDSSQASTSQPAATLTVTPAKRGARSSLARLESGAMFSGENGAKGKKTPILELPKPPNTGSINRMLRNQKREMSEVASEIGDTEAMTTEAEETQPTPCPPRTAKSFSNNRRRPSTSAATDTTDGLEETVTPRARRSFGKTSGKPTLDLGEFLDEQLRKASAAKARKSLSFASQVSPTSDDEEEVEATPTKSKTTFKAAKKNATPKQKDEVKQTIPSSEGSHSSGLEARRPPARPKKARRSYNAKVNTPHKLDLSQTDASSVRELHTAFGTISRSSPPPDTDIEGSGTEANLTPASARVFNNSSSPLIPTASPKDSDHERDASEKVGEDTLPSQPISPTKSKLPKELPSHLAGYFDAQKQLVLKTLRSPPFIEVAPVVLGERAIVEKSAYEQLNELLTASCERGEGNSCLLLGSRGSGKTLLFETALKNCTSKPIVIRLSGHTQTTDRLAMREIAYQLSHQTERVFDIPEDELEADNVDPKQPSTGEESIDITPPAAYLPTLISQLTTLKRPVVVVLDVFDLFATHSRQALLYCLLDTVQSCRVGEGRNGLLVVGVSSVVNCINTLEKRVKSRFSHRVLKVPNPSSFAAYLDIAKKLLGTGLDAQQYGKGKGRKAPFVEWNNLWTESIESFISNKKTRVALLEAYGLRRDIGNLAKLLAPVVHAIDHSNPWLSPLVLEASESSQLPQQYAFMHHLPQAAMWILVALYHWGSAGHDNVNLKMVLDACAKAASFQDGFRLVVTTTESRGLSSSVMAPAMLQASFEDLVRLRVLQSTTATAQVSSEYVKYRCMVDRETLRRIVEKNGSTSVKNWLIAPGVTV